MGKVTLNVQILDSLHSEGTQLRCGGFQRDPLKKRATRLLRNTFLLCKLGHLPRSGTSTHT
jgi:hypothetical protein